MKDDRFARAARMLLDVEHRQATRKFRRAFRHWKSMWKRVRKQEIHNAAVKIQGVWRGFYAKRRVDMFRKAGKAVRLRGVTLALRMCLMERTWVFERAGSRIIALSLSLSMYFNQLTSLEHQQVPLDVVRC